jgi:hypothetical protein
MHYYTPILRLADELPPQSKPQDKLGGLPWGIGPHLWPTCRECEKSQSLLAQFVHDSERLDLGRAGRVLSVFQCNHDPGSCSTWEGGSGANACFITEPEDLSNGLSQLPQDSPVIQLEARIDEWLTQDDGIAQTDAPLFFSDTGLTDLSVAEIDKVTTHTKLGSVPFWVQSADEAPKEGWRFVGQLDSLYSFLRPPSVSFAGLQEDRQRSEGRSHWCEGSNFGDAGIAYLFVRNTSTKPEAWFFWQCS